MRLTESKVRIELNQLGRWHITAEPLGPVKWTGRLMLAEDRVQSSELFLRHKTTNRDIYERNLAEARRMGFDEVLFMNERSDLTEGAISNIFVQMDGTWRTPTVASGVLPGIQRSLLLQSLSPVEARDVSISDLSNAEEICVCNALRGVRPVYSIERSDGTLMWKKATAPAALR